MKMKIAVWTLMALLVGTSAWAKCGGDQCPMKGYDKECSGKSECSEKGGCPITAKTVKKASFFLENKEVIGLSEAQVAEIKSIKNEAEKSQIRQGAEMQIMMLDLEGSLHQEPLDVEGFNAYMDKGAAAMANAGKQSFAAYAKLKSILTPEQMTKAKAAWKKK
jgi:hypothetical protein